MSNLPKTKEVKLMIIENFIDHYTTHEKEREEMKDNARTYVEEDWVDEIDQAFAGLIDREKVNPKSE